MLADQPTGGNEKKERDRSKLVSRPDADESVTNWVAPDALPADSGPVVRSTQCLS